MYVSMARLRVDGGRESEVIEAFRRRMHLVDRFDGFIDLEVWHSDRDPEEMVMISRWHDRDSFKAYMKSDAHRRSHDRIDPELDRAISLQRLEHMHTYEVVAD
jgi:heme-degrading monooxygenase HmoA